MSGKQYEIISTPGGVPIKVWTKGIFIEEQTGNLGRTSGGNFFLKVNLNFEPTLNQTREIV
ncbi:hypothetical protein ACFL54_01680 [Planctomycetota bacterium]